MAPFWTSEFLGELEFMKNQPFVNIFFSKVGRCLDFLHSHTYSLFDTYGEEYLDLIEDIPDPTELPLKILEDFLFSLRTLGVWFAERASLVLLIKIDKLKTREKYERHFLLLSMIYTEMVRIRRLCNIAFANLSEKEKIENFSKPKVLKLVEILKQYKPDHIQTPGHHKKAKPVPSTPKLEPGINSFKFCISPKKCLYCRFSLLHIFERKQWFDKNLGNGNNCHKC